ncbi:MULTISPECIES: NADPH:quinone oxidoreductase family protein [Alcaligenaceae]|uniref:NADPH quinone oxidoreductase, putative n=1 Tax=Bordetella petrii (strain ATCC BAA-461 / DSM 12804 / CCUG 43448 / CIP 107267 / Se-1111R) TaxID=340100 RepID=A9IDN9_BORPD|nr:MULTISPECIES: NADPH:quinone oxidoreductase family protein [Alcaligenaceae]CAP41580.1 NADPH quinone oxidoreductase, putative [Bordetella petrii]CUJ31555.1 Mycocerosic acid synthase [Achromobacter xylosoxidans]CUJ71607.1 Mycocerosic acid synthase [Achromobacter xylosoxidans]
MKAVVIREFAEPEHLKVEEIADPVAGPGEVLINVTHAGINFPDVLVMTGKYQNLPDRPFVPGKDAAGSVVAVGPGVVGLKEGDRVVAQVEHGAFAERMVAPAASCYPLPASISDRDAAGMGLVYQTAFFALVERGQFSAGETVLINGAAGGVGGAAVQLVKALGGTALAGVAGEQQAAATRALGADHIIDLAAPDLRDSLREQVFACTGGRGADVVLDPLGDEIFDASIRAVAWCGRLVCIGFAAGRIPTLKVNYLLVKNIAVSGLQWSDYRDRQPEKVRDVQQRLYDLHAKGLLRPQITEVLPLARFAEPLRILADGKGSGKYVLQFC